MTASDGSLARYAASRLATAVLVLVGAHGAALLADPDRARRSRDDPARAARHARDRWRSSASRWGSTCRFTSASSCSSCMRVQGDLGVDVLNGRPVADMVIAALPNTLMLALSAIGLAVLIGIPIGCYAAVRPGSLLDQALAIVSVGLVATPSYVVAILLLYFFSVRLGWFPVLGAGDAGNILDQLHHLVLPTRRARRRLDRLHRAAGALLAARSAGRALSSAPRAPMASRSAGWSMKYALKLACIPTVAILGVGIGELMGGAVFVEIIFNRPGLGSLIFDAITQPQLSDRAGRHPGRRRHLRRSPTCWSTCPMPGSIRACARISAAPAPEAAPDARRAQPHLAKPERPARADRDADRRARRAGGAADRHAHAEPDRRRRAHVAAFGRAIGSAPTISAATCSRAACSGRGSPSAWRWR